jgi:hypothetical protein
LNSKKSSIVIKFYHQIVELSQNKDDETGVHNINKYKNSIYNAYNFCPTMDMTQIMYQIGRQEQRFGHDINSNNTITIFQMAEPLPDDIFYFYSEPNEIFRVVTVQYLQTVHKDLKLYQITYDNAPIQKNSLNEYIDPYINENYYFNNEYDLWFKGMYYTFFSKIVKHKDDIISSLQKYYDPLKCRYSCLEINNNQLKIDFINEKITFLKNFGHNFKAIINYKYNNPKEKYFDQYNYPLPFTIDDCYIPDPNYIAPNPVDPLVYVYDPFEGKLKLELFLKVGYLYNLYKTFIEIKLGLEPKEIDSIPDSESITIFENKLLM